MTRDIRFTEYEIICLIDAARNERRKLERSIKTAVESQAKGNTIQRGTLERHYKRLDGIKSAEVALDVARREIGRQIAAKLA